MSASGVVRADAILLRTGHVILAQRAWYEGSRLCYEAGGGVCIPSQLVVRIEEQPTGPADQVAAERARTLLEAGEPLGATRLLLPALAANARSGLLLRRLAEAYLALGDNVSAEAFARRAVSLDATDAEARSLWGDALSRAGDLAGAEREYGESLKLRSDADVRRRLDEASRALGQRAGARLRLRYDGGVNEPLGTAVIETLSRAYEEHAERLGFQPGGPVTVVLQTQSEFRGGLVPSWAEGVNDGTIRIPVQGMNTTTPRLAAVLRHELAHSFLADRTGGNCPTWLHEGVAQWLEGGIPSRADAGLAAHARTGKLVPLLSLEGPFESLGEERAALAYAESLAAVAHILRRYGPAGIRRLVGALGSGLPAEQALPRALGTTYPQLQAGLETDLSRLR